MNSLRASKKSFFEWNIFFQNSQYRSATTVTTCAWLYICLNFNFLYTKKTAMCLSTYTAIPHCIYTQCSPSCVYCQILIIIVICSRRPLSLTERACIDVCVGKRYVLWHMALGVDRRIYTVATLVSLSLFEYVWELLSLAFALSHQHTHTRERAREREKWGMICLLTSCPWH